MLVGGMLSAAAPFTDNTAGRGTGVPARGITLSGAGATFPLPFYNAAFKVYYERTGKAVTYGGIGSGSGIRALRDRLVDFAGTDAFLSDEEMAGMPGEVVHVPTCMEAVVVAYNLPGVEELRLTGEVVADIFRGEVVKWNDPGIAALNPGVELPDRDITPVYRSDGSGTTLVFSDYLSKVSTTWRETMGSATSLTWPAGVGAKGNPGVAGIVSQTPYTIGYVGSEYAFAMGIPAARLRNAAGVFVLPTTASISAAAGGIFPPTPG